MPTAFAWARVSSKDQEQSGNSIPGQLRSIREFAQAKGINITQEYSAGESAFQGDRDQFEAMVADALRLRPDFVLADESSRFSRNREVSIRVKRQLRKAGIHLLFVNEPDIDPGSITGHWVEGIQELKNEATSLEIAFATIRGMKANTAARDPETGWCYHNGGRPPYGYRRRVLEKGHDSKGKPVLKTVLELDPEQAPIVHQMIVDLYTAQRMSYDRIRDYLNQHDVPCPAGGPWGTSTIVEMLRDNRLEQYAGRGFWNKEARGKNTGHRFNDRSQWVVVENAHPALITPEELQDALARHSDGRAQGKYARTQESQYLFTGLNFEGQPMFVCSTCGSSLIGYRNGKPNWRKYICGRARYKGAKGCPDLWRIDVALVEDWVLAKIRDLYTAPAARKQAVAAVLGRLGPDRLQSRLERPRRPQQGTGPAAAAPG